MKARLTIRLESSVFARAKRIAKQRGTSVSRMASEYLQGLVVGKQKVEMEDLPPITRSLAGSLAGSNLSEKDYKLYLERKYI